MKHAVALAGLLLSGMAATADSYQVDVTTILLKDGVYRIGFSGVEANADVYMDCANDGCERLDPERPVVVSGTSAGAPRTRETLEPAPVLSARTNWPGACTVTQYSRARYVSPPSCAAGRTAPSSSSSTTSGVTRSGGHPEAVVRRYLDDDEDVGATVIDVTAAAKPSRSETCSSTATAPG